MLHRHLAVLSFAGALGFAQSPSEPPSANQGGGLKLDNPPTGEFTITPGTKVPLSLINSISTKQSVEGDRVYLETAYTVMAGGRIVITIGSYVEGPVHQITKP